VVWTESAGWQWMGKQYIFGTDGDLSGFSVDLSLVDGRHQLLLTEADPSRPLLDWVGNPLILDVYVNVPMPNDPPRFVAVTGLLKPFPVESTVDPGTLCVDVFENSPSLYLVTWDFGTEVALVEGDTVPRRKVQIRSNGTLIYANEGRIRVAFDQPLAFARAGVFDVTATVEEVQTGLSTTSSGSDAALVVFDPYSGASASGKGTVTMPGAKPARVDFSIAYLNGVPRGRLDCVLGSENLRFRADAFSCFAASGSRAAATGSGTLNGVRGATFRMDVDDVGNAIRVEIRSADGQSGFGMMPALDTSTHGDIVVSAPPNG
jgi:hypothetical protein